MTPNRSGDGTQRATGSDRHPVDERLRLLADRTRRLTIGTFLDHGVDELPVAALADVIAAEHQHDPGRRRVQIELHHVHLPKLETVGVLTYDADSSIVRYRGDELLEQCLGALGREDG